MSGPLIYHVAQRAHWREAVARGEYGRSTRDQSFDEVGFIHCSTAGQVRFVLETFYSDLDDLVLLTIEADQFGGDELRYENTSGGTELFPHLYRRLPVTAVSAVTDVADLGPELG